MLVSLEIDPNRKDAQNANQRSSNGQQQVFKTEQGEERRMDVSRGPGPPDGPHRRTTKGPPLLHGDFRILMLPSETRTLQKGLKG